MIEWRAVPRWEGFYEVSDSGLVRSMSRQYMRERNGWSCSVSVRNRILSPAVCNGYYRVHLKDGDRSEKAYVHRLVCEAFHGLPLAGCEVAHGNGKRLDCRAENLRWATRTENMRDKAIHGTQRRGEQIHLTKITEGQARHILTSSRKNAELARDLGIAPSTISNVRTGKSWRHLQESALWT